MPIGEELEALSQEELEAVEVCPSCNGTGCQTDQETGFVHDDVCEDCYGRGTVTPW